VQAAQEALRPPPAVPAHDRARDLVADRVGEQRLVTAARAHARADALLDGSHESAIVQEGDVLLPGEPDQHAQVVLGRGVEQPLGRHGVRAHGVDPARRHGGEVGAHHVGRREQAGVVAATEGAVGDAAQQQLLVPREEELAAHAQAIQCRPAALRRGCGSQRRGGLPVGGRNARRRRHRLQRGERRARSNAVRPPRRDEPCPFC
jgi:hypothetical protein